MLHGPKNTTTYPVEPNNFSNRVTEISPSCRVSEIGHNCRVSEIRPSFRPLIRYIIPESSLCFPVLKLQKPHSPISIMSILTLIVVICCFFVQLVYVNLANLTTALNCATEATTVTATAAETPTNCTSYPLSRASFVSYPTTPVSEIPHGWTNLASHPTAPASETLHSWMNHTSYPTRTGACWKPIPTGVFWPHPSGASVSCAGRQLTPTGLNTTRRFLVPTTARSIPSISSASDRYGGGWSGFIGKWVVFCVVGVYQVA